MSAVETCRGSPPKLGGGLAGDMEKYLGGAGILLLARGQGVDASANALGPCAMRHILGSRGVATVDIYSKLCMTSMYHGAIML